MTKIVAKIGDFLRLEAAAGLMLMAAALLALVASNSFLNAAYDRLLTTPFIVQIGALVISKPVLLWINDGLMAVFFFLVGLEIKREILESDLSSFDKVSLPLFAAIGGMAAPAIVYASFNWGDLVAMKGWAIPAATDIAFALGFLALAAARAPTSLKVFLLAVAIIDDLGAIVIIALFYTEQLSLGALGLASAGVFGLFAANRLGVKAITPYALIGAVTWVCVLKSGVHATLAGVITALMIPMYGRGKDAQSPLHRVEHDLHPWVAFGVLPLFAFANAGLSFSNLSLAALLAPIPIGVALGLFVGKPLGVLAMSAIAVRCGLARLPAAMTWRHLAGVAWLTGVGFTMSLFIGGLAFDDADRLNQVRLGVLAGSLASALAGCLVLTTPATGSRPVARRLCADSG